MELLQKLEVKLVEILDKKAPVKLSQNVRKRLADALWVLALIFGVLQLSKVFEWFALRIPNADIIGSVEPYLGFFYHLSLIVLVVAAVMMLVAAPGLKARKKDGWNLVFYALLANVAYGVVRLLSGVPGGFGSLIWALVVSGVSGYVLFQVRGQFTKNGGIAHKK